MVETSYRNLEDGKPYLIYGYSGLDGSKYFHIFIYKDVERWRMHSYYRLYSRDNELKERCAFAEFGFTEEHILDKEFWIFELSQEEFNYHIITEEL